MVARNELPVATEWLGQRTSSRRCWKKHRENVFKHWLPGLGSSELEIHTPGARSEWIDVFNVRFIGSKVETIQRLISEDPHAA